MKSRWKFQLHFLGGLWKAYSKVLRCTVINNRENFQALVQEQTRRPMKYDRIQRQACVYKLGVSTKKRTPRVKLTDARLGEEIYIEWHGSYLEFYM